MLSDTHLDLVLADRGVIDLVGLTPRSPMQTLVGRGRSAIDLARLLRRYNRKRPAENKIVEPNLALSSPTTGITAPAGAELGVPTTIVNRSRWWLSSAFPYHPVHVAYRIYAADGSMVVENGHRTKLAAPLGPNGSVTLDTTVELPAEPGAYTLAVTLVQEAFAWFDELDPHCVLRIPVQAE